MCIDVYTVYQYIVLASTEKLGLNFCLEGTTSVAQGLLLFCAQAKFRTLYVVPGTEPVPAACKTFYICQKCFFHPPKVVVL